MVNLESVIGCIFNWIIPTLIIAWLVSIVVAICCLAKEEWYKKAAWYLCWALFPFPILWRKRNISLFKRWLLVLISPCLMSFYIFLLFTMAVVFAMGSSQSGVPSTVPYHTSADLRRITGVDFPDVMLVDSSYYEDWNRNEVKMKFVPLQTLNKRFSARLNKACVNDSCCWQKDSIGYHYFIFPEYPIDRTKGTHIRQEETSDGDMMDAWDGYFISVFVPFKGDTITVSEGWCR